MILLVPISPEVPRQRKPSLWPALITVLVLCISFIEVWDTTERDAQYVDSLQSFVTSGADGVPRLSDEATEYLKLRPLLKVAPAKADWDLARVFYANFIHGSLIHLLLNLVGVFAGMRICATFIPFAVSVSIFLVGGSLGLLTSLLVSSEVSEYIPHVGASAGIFALMGTYYIYNFGYRTKYFFWFPSRRGFINLRTSWFFFLDVLLLELVLSLAQFSADRLDSVDHIAHVVGFLTGMGLAFFLRTAQRWPSFLQTRGEFLYWMSIIRPKVYDPVFTPLEVWLDLLDINRYNDHLKAKVCTTLFQNSEVVPDQLITRAFKFLTATYVRLHAAEVSRVLVELMSKKRQLPTDWLKRMPYDSVIRLARYMTDPPELQPLLFRFVTEYRRAHPEGGDVDRKLELLMSKLVGVVPEEMIPPQVREPSSPGLPLKKRVRTG